MVAAITAQVALRFSLDPCAWRRGAHELPSDVPFPRHARLEAAALLRLEHGQLAGLAQRSHNQVLSEDPAVEKRSLQRRPEMDSPRCPPRLAPVPPPPGPISDPFGRSTDSFAFKVARNL
jgi:hypothetical protein